MVREAILTILFSPDYTIPRAAREDALRLYHFRCGCARCREDLDVYQVCSMSPNINLNKFSLQPDVSKLRNPQIDSSKISSSDVEAIYKKWHALAPSEDMDAMKVARLRWKLCKPLVEAKMWAVEPLPSSIHEFAGMCQSDDKKIAYALPLACFLATECEPVKLVAPFLPWRVKGMMMVAKLLSYVGELRATGELEKT